jgi:hypothetical protein
MNFSEKELVYKKCEIIWHYINSQKTNQTSIEQEHRIWTACKLCLLHLVSSQYNHVLASIFFRG